jgi:glycosyltransferase involved in cell wall biosynthesis
MNLGINSTTLNEIKMSGFSRFSIGITKALLSKDPNALIYLDKKNIYEDLDFWKNKNLRAVNSIYNVNSTTENFSRLFWNQFVLPRMTYKDKVNVIYSTTPDGSCKPNFEQYITIHDLIPIIYPDSNPRLKFYYKYFLPNIISACKGIFVTSRNTKYDLLQHFNFEEDKIHVIYQGYNDEIFFPNRNIENASVRLPEIFDSNSAIEAQFLLCVAESRPYKNLNRLIRAFARANLNNLNLVLVGKKTRLSEGLETLALSLGVRQQVIFSYDTSDMDLQYLYNNALAFIFPSLYEGFGIPPLEAMACGCPVAASQTSSLPEICGDAALFFDPEDTDSISNSFQLLYYNQNLRNELSIKGIERAKKFTYNSAADKILEVVCT